MARIAETGEYEVMVVDTPPAGGGADFLQAPERIRRLLAGRALRILTGSGLPGRRLLYSFTARPALRLADSVLGGRLLQDVAEFLLDLSKLYTGMARRARALDSTLRAAARVVVTTSEPGPVAEAGRLVASSHDGDVVVFNRSLPGSWATARPGSGPVAQSLALWSTEARRQLAVRRTFAAAHGTDIVEVPWLAEAPAGAEELGALMESAGLRAL
jgi:anion-transporting  ArsA/GET3 family ATPase